MFDEQLSDDALRPTRSALVCLLIALLTPLSMSVGCGPRELDIGDSEHGISDLPDYSNPSAGLVPDHRFTTEPEHNSNGADDEVLALLSVHAFVRNAQADFIEGIFGPGWRSKETMLGGRRTQTFIEEELAETSRYNGVRKLGRSVVPLSLVYTTVKDPRHGLGGRGVIAVALHQGSGMKGFLSGFDGDRKHQLLPHAIRRVPEDNVPKYGETLSAFTTPVTVGWVGDLDSFVKALNKVPDLDDDVVWGALRGFEYGTLSKSQRFASNYSGTTDSVLWTLPSSIDTVVSIRELSESSTDVGRESWATNQSHCVFQTSGKVSALVTLRHPLVPHATSRASIDALCTGCLWWSVDDWLGVSMKEKDPEAAVVLALLEGVKFRAREFTYKVLRVCGPWDVELELVQD